VSLGVDIFLVRHPGEEQTTLANFHFELKDVRVYTSQTNPIQQTFDIKHNGIEVRCIKI